MADKETTRQNLYDLQAFLFKFEEAEEVQDDLANCTTYIQVLKLLAEDKGFDFISQQLNDPNVRFETTLKQWNPILSYLISDALSRLEPDRKHRLFLKKISDMTGYEYQEYLKYLEIEGLKK